MALTSLHVKDVCYAQAGQQNPWMWNNDKTCRYLTYETVGKKSVCLCMKKAPGIIEQKLLRGELPRDWNKLGDNCPGYRYLKHADQGYNVP